MPKTNVEIPDEDLRGLSLAALQAKYGMTRDQIRGQRRKRGINVMANAIELRDGRQPTFDEAMPDPKSPEAVHELYERISALKVTEKKFDPRRHKVGLTLPGDAPVGVVFTGDWQLGSMGVNYDLWWSDLHIMHDFHKSDPEGLFAIGMGDYGSHFRELNSRGSAHNDTARSSDQIALAGGVFHETRGMWLVLLAGCHDTFHTKAGDDDVVRKYCELARIDADDPNAPPRHGWHGVEATLRLSDQSYVLRLRHKYGFHSALNVANSARREAEMEGPADLIAHGHRHTSFIEESQTVGRDTVKVRNGSYQIHDDYARQAVGNVKADPRQPLVIFYPDRHHMKAFRDFRDGLEFLRFERARYQEQEAA